MCRAARPDAVAVTTASPGSSSAATAWSASGTGVGSVTGGTTWSTCSRASKWRANAAALSPAARDASEKSVATRTLRMRRGLLMAVVSSWLHGIAGAGAAPPRRTLAFLDDQHRAWRVPENLLGDRAEQEPAHAAETTRPDHDEVGIVSGRHDHVGRIAGGRRSGHPGDRALELGGSLLEHALELTPAFILDFLEHPGQVSAHCPRRRGWIADRLDHAEQAQLRPARWRQRQEEPES